MTASDSSGGRGRRLLVLAAVVGTLGALAVAAARSGRRPEVDIGEEVDVSIENAESVVPDAVAGSGSETDDDPAIEVDITDEEDGPSEAEDEDPAEPDAAIEPYEDGGGNWRWRLVAGEENLARSPTGYDDRAAADEALERFRAVAPGADADGEEGFELYEDGGGNWRWRLRETETGLAVSSRGYDSRERALDAIGRVREVAADAPVTEE